VQLRASACRETGVGFALVLGLLGSMAVAVAAEPRRSSRNPSDLAGYDALVSAEDRSHWAFQPVRVPAVPEVKDRSWSRNPIDRFVLARLEEAGWRPSPAAEPRALVRRLFLNLTGLPPTLEEQSSFVHAAARTPDAVERLVDDLLARPAYGERWARHWLDLVRYADSNGYERDALKPFAWRYRDYVIRAFNADKPFDRFVIEQLAGDELPDEEVSAETLIATGYYRLGPWDDEPADPKQDRYDQLDDMVGTTSEVFLGLTLGCARCHNHKFEPLTQHDYYRMVAVFNPLQRPQKGRDERALPVGEPAALAALARRDEAIAAVEKALAEVKKEKDSPARSGRFKSLGSEIERLRRETPDLPLGYILREPSPKAPETHILLRGQAGSPGLRVAPGVPSVLASSQPSFPEPARDSKTSGRRLALARWLTGSRNPLTARVIVNRVWQSHFGAALVRTPSDFGTMGEPPTHPELLDWLASWFVENGWSIKKLHRLILTSATYRMSTRVDPTYAAEDPDDLLLWRMPYRRLEAEAVRDAMLAVTGRLDRRMYGSGMYPFIPREALEGHSDPNRIWEPFDEAASSRRTVYTVIKRSLVVPMLDLLDFCDTSRSAAKRNVTSVPTQALTLLNGDFVNRSSRHLADRLEREAGTAAADQVERAFFLAFCRAPTERERAEMLAFLDRETPGTVRARHEALVQLCRALLNANEFVYPD
jgi:hypothetical protein